jgi:tetratricopeptide (TPR) repeat protein
VYYKISKFEPFPYRLGNVLFHTTTGVLIFFFVFLVLSRLKRESFFKTNSLLIAFVTALLFLLHPVQTQTVSYVIQGELEGLAMLFIMSISLCFVMRSFSQSRTVQYSLTVLLFVLLALSCGTKEIAIISPLLLLIVDWFFVSQGDWKFFKKQLPLHVVCTSIVLSLYIWFLNLKFFTDIIGFRLEAKNNIGNVITENSTDIITPLTFFISQFKVILHYLMIFLWPFNISVEYDWVMVRGFFAPDCIFPFLGLVIIGYLLIKELWRNSTTVIGFGMLWFFCCILPRSSIIPSPELIVDYKTYIASFGWLLVIACAIVYCVQKALWHRVESPKIVTYLRPMYAQALLLVVLAIPVGMTTISRNTVWRSGVEFWDSIIKNAPGKARAYNNYGVELSQTHQKFEEAVEYFKKAIAMDSKYPDPCNNLAVAYSALGKVDMAIAALKESIKINPSYPEAYNNLASFHIQKKEYETAENLLMMAIKLRPYYGKAYFNLGRVYLVQQKQEEAWICFRDACTKADMDNDLGFSTFANLSMALKKYDEAIIGYKKTLDYNPNFPEAMQNLGDAYSLAKRYAEAIPIYESLVSKPPVAPQVIFNLGEAYCALNNPERGLTCFKKIEHLSAMQPLIPLRVAECLIKMGQPERAEQTLLSFLHSTASSSSEMPAVQVRNAAKQLLAQISGGKQIKTI